MAIYMQMEGIKGNVTTEGYKDWVEVDSFEWGTTRVFMTMVGQVADREGATPSFSEISLSKSMDQSSPYLFTESVKGKGKKVELHIVRTDAEGVTPYVKYDLENCMVSSYSASSGGDRPSESFSLNYTKVTMNYIPGKEDHTADAPIPAGYDLEKAAKV